MTEIPISPDGYLSTNTEIENNIYLANKGVFDHAYRLNRLCQGLKEQFLPRDQEGQKVISNAVFIKILNGFQAIVILTKKGLKVESEILLRTILEALFILKILCEDDEFYKKYISMDAVRRKTLITVAQKNNYAVFEATRKILTEEFLEDLEEEIRKSGVDRGDFKVEQLAIKAKLHDLYESVYRLTSEAVHSQIRSLSSYVKEDAQGKVVSFYDGPIGDISDEVDTAMTMLIAAVESMQNLYKLGALPELQALIDDVVRRRKSKSTQDNKTQD